MRFSLPFLAQGICYNQDNVVRVSCSAEACDNDVPGCFRVSNDTPWLTDDCSGVGSACSTYSEQGSCSSQYGCAWDSDTFSMVATIAILCSLALTAIGFSVCVVYTFCRWRVLKRREQVASLPVQSAKAVTFAASVEEGGGSSTGVKREEVEVVEAVEVRMDATGVIDVEAAGCKVWPL